MKTKKVLLPGMLATMAFAACTNEELVTMPNAIPEIDLSNRPMVGVVDLDFTPQSATRMAQGNDAFNQVVWENGDKIGARIIDKPNGGNYKDHSLNYTAIDEYASSNYEYTKGDEDGIWRTEALLVEGNYMFYAPYNPSQGREALVFNFPYEQTINKVEDGKVNEDAIMNFFKNKKNQTVVVGHSFVDATEHTTKVSPFMEHLYAYPQFTLNVQKDFAAYVIDGAEKDTIATDLKITKIIITNDKIKDKYQVSHSELIKMMRNEVAENKNDKDNYDDNGEVKAGRWQSALNLLRDGKTSDILKAYSGAVTKKVVISLDEAYTAGSEDVVKFHAVLPGFDYAANSLDVNIVFADKNGTEWIFKAPIELDEALTFAPGKRYPREEYDFSDTYTKGYATKASAGQLVSYNVVSGEIEKYVADKDPVYIKYASELAEWLATNVTNNTATVTEGDDFILEPYKNLSGSEAWKNGKPMLQFNDSVVDAVNQYLDKGKIVFKSQMIVSENMTPSKDRFAFNGGIFQTAGTLTLDGVTLGGSTFNGTVILKGGATLTGAASFKAATITNADIQGAITFNGNATVKTLTSATNATVKSGVVTIDESSNAALNIAIEGGEVILNKANYDKNITVGTIKDSKADKAGTLTIGAENALTKVFFNNGTVNINAKVNGVGDSYFSANWKFGTLKVNNNGTIDATSFTNKAKIVNNGTILAKVTNPAGSIIENNTTMTVSSNEGKITVAEGSSTYVLSGSAAGEIDNTNRGALFLDGCSNTVTYTFDKLQTTEDIEKFDAVLYGINKVIFKAGIDFNKEFEHPELVFYGVNEIDINGGTVAVAANLAMPVNAKVMNITGDVTIDGFKKDVSTLLISHGNAMAGKEGTKINVAKNAVLTIKEITVGANKVGSEAEVKLMFNFAKPTTEEAKAGVMAGAIKIQNANLYYGANGTAVSADALDANSSQESKYWDGTAWN